MQGWAMRGWGCPHHSGSEAGDSSTRKDMGWRPYSVRGYEHSSSGPDLWELGCGLGRRGSAGTIPSSGSPR